jgi:hypothetical protein
MRYAIIVLWMLFGSMSPAVAQVSIGIGLPNISIGINLPLYPEFEQVPGYPVYYAPQVNSNYFFYDGMYWVFQSDNWYASSWYNGPWWLMGPEVVPLFVLRIPVRYYRAAPVYFSGWRLDAPPRWGEHWGNAWQQRRSGWDRWNRSSVPAPAPLPVYQRQYSGNRYPRVEQQQALRSRNYPYQPRTAVVRQHYRAQVVQGAPAPSQRGQQGAPREKSPGQRDIRRSNPPPPPQQSSVPRSQAPQRTGEDVQRSAPRQAPPQQKGPAVGEQRQQPQPREVQREPQTPRGRQENGPQGKGAPQEPRQGQERDREGGEDRGQQRNR